MENLAKLLTSIAAVVWPAIIFGIFLMLLPIIENFYTSDRLMVKVGNIEISASKAADQQIAQLSDVQVRLSRLEGRIASPIDQRQLPRDGLILWVDDHPENNAVEIALLEAQNFRVQTKISTTDALEFVEQYQ